jgi:hypothetical protein
MDALFGLTIQLIMSNLRQFSLGVETPERSEEKVADFQKTLLGRQLRNMAVDPG